MGLGLLRLPSQSPFQTLRLTLLPRTPSTLKTESWEFRLTQSLSNTWVNEPDYFIDNETLHSSVSASRRFKDVLIEMSFEERRLMNGALDGFIKNFHEKCGIDQDGRDKAPYGEVDVRLYDRRGDEIMDWKGGKGAFSQGLTASVQHNITPGAARLPAFSYTFCARYNIWDAIDLETDFPFDLGMSFSMAKKIGKANLYLAPGVLWCGSTGFEMVRFKRTQLSCLLGFEWRISQSLSALLQYLFSEGAVRDFGSFSDPSHEVSLGFKGKLSKKLIWELGLLENIITYDNSPDFGLHWGISFRM